MTSSATVGEDGTYSELKLRHRMSYYCLNINVKLDVSVIPKKYKTLNIAKENSQKFPFSSFLSENEHGASTGKQTSTPSLVLTTLLLKSRVAGPKYGNYL
jgi:hypothetical protein